MTDLSFYKGKRVFITGHTGFKGSWLCHFLHLLGAEVYGYALPPADDAPLYNILDTDGFVHSVYGDVRDLGGLKKAMADARPDIAIHMAAQALVRESYEAPVATYATNVMGTVHFLEAARACGVRAIVNVTTDKVYKNDELGRPFSEEDSFGGKDPYSNSKACSELVTYSYGHSFFPPDGVSRLASARAGNVIGGGDFSKNRLIPDCVRAALAGQTVVLRSPRSVRPWQHVMEPLTGYLTLAKALYENGAEYSGGWNFGPAPQDHVTTERVVALFCEKWGGMKYEIVDMGGPHEAGCLKLDITKSAERLGFGPRLGLDGAVGLTVEWTKGYESGEDMAALMLRQIEEYIS